MANPSISYCAKMPRPHHSLYNPFPPVSTGHAHPDPQDQLPDWHSIPRLISDIGIRFELGGLSGGNSPKVIDVYNPDVWRSSASDDFVQHLDVVSCWKGLSYPCAAEMAYWNTNFAQCVLRKVSDAMIFKFADYVRDENECVDRTTLLPCLLRYIGINSVHTIDFDMSELVTTMIETFYADDGQLRHNWFISTNNMPSMIFNFIRTRDCFLDTSPLPSMQIQLKYERVCSESVLVFDVGRQIPLINFQGLASSLLPGSEYRISPTYQHRILSLKFGLFPTEPSYSLKLDDRSRISLAWSPAGHCFRGTVPEDCVLGRPGEPGRPPIVTDTIFFARITTQFPGNVEFEQTTRYRIVLSLDLPLVDPSLRNSSGDLSAAVWQVCHPALPTLKVGLEENILHRCPGDSNYDADSDTSAGPFANHVPLKLLDIDGSDVINKRKASEQIPSEPTLLLCQEFEKGQFAIENLDHNTPMQTPPKRLKTLQCIDSGVWDLIDIDDVHSSGSLVLEHLTTGVLGEASADPSLGSEQPQWYKRLGPELDSSTWRRPRSRAYEADNAKVIPALKKKGSVKRIIIPRARRATRNDSNGEHSSGTVALVTPIDSHDSAIVMSEDQPEDAITKRSCEVTVSNEEQEDKHENHVIVSNEGHESERQRLIEDEMRTYRDNYAMFLERRAAMARGELAPGFDEDEDRDPEVEQAFIWSGSEAGGSWGTGSSVSASPLNASG